MDQIIAEICRESISNQQLHIQSQVVIKQLKEGTNLTLLDEVVLVLRLSSLCIESLSAKNRLGLLGIELLRFYVRHLANIVSATTETIDFDKLIDHFLSTLETISVEHLNKVRSDLLSVLVDFSTTFATHLSVRQVICIVHFLDREIRNYYHLKTKSSTTLKPLGSIDRQLVNASNATRLVMAKITANLSANGVISIPLNNGSHEDKTLSAISLAAGQVCHFFVKQKVSDSSTDECSNDSIESNEEGSTSDKASASVRKQNSQDLSYLLLYLSKKLETKVSFYYDALRSQSKGEDVEQADKEDKTSQLYHLETLTPIKVENCFYLKCIHYTLLTIPDAWQGMSSHFIEIIARQLAPPLVSILTPSVKTTKAIRWNESKAGSSHQIGRGAKVLAQERLLDNELDYQERQFVFKITTELLRLFGLEGVMRPLLEAIFYRIFLLPPLKQRVEAYIYMQEVLKNDLLVIILISDPICLFDPSVSNSTSFGLLQIFIDSIKEAIDKKKNHSLASQQALICWSTLLTTLQNILCSTVKESALLASPTIRRLLGHVAVNETVYECLANVGESETSTTTELRRRYRSKIDINNLKDRICGYDAQGFYSKTEADAIKAAKQAKAKEMPNDLWKYFGKDQPEMNEEAAIYRSRLTAIMGKTQSSSGISGEENYNESFQSCFKNLSRHLSLDTFNRLELNYLTATTKRTSSEGELCRYRSESKNNVIWSSETYLDDCPLEQEYESRSASESISENKNSMPSIPMTCNESDGRKESNSTEDTDEDVNEDDKVYEETELQQQVIFNRTGYGTLFRNVTYNQATTINIGHLERTIARIFTRRLVQVLVPELLDCPSSMAIVRLDEVMQNFASDFCKTLYRNLRNFGRTGKIEEELNLEQSERQLFVSHRILFEELFINADGIYLATYQAFLLNLRLNYNGYYQAKIKENISISERQFVDAVFTTGANIHLSYAFLAEVYQQVLEVNFLEPYYQRLSTNNALESVAFFQLLEDIEAVNIKRSSTGTGFYQLSDYARLEKIGGRLSRTTSESSVEAQEAQVLEEEDQMSNNKIAEVDSNQARCLRLIIRRACHYFWSTFLICVESNLDSCRRPTATFNKLVEMTSNNAVYIGSVLKILACLDRQELAKRTIFSHCIDLMVTLFRLALRANYTERTNSLYELFLHFIMQLGRSEITSSPTGNGNLNNTTLGASGDVNLSLTLTAPQAEAVKVFLVYTHQVGSHQATIWPAFFSLACFLADQETILFRSIRWNLFSRAKVSINSLLRSNSFTNGLGNSETFSGKQSGKSGRETFYSSSSSSSFYSTFDFSTLPGVHEAQTRSLEIEFDRLIANWRHQRRKRTANLEPREIETVLEYLNAFVSIIFETVTVRYNLPTMAAFVSSLVDFSLAQLTEIQSAPLPRSTQFIESRSLALTRLVDVMLRFIRNGRPLVHFMRLWSPVSSHLVHAAACNEPTVAKRALSAIYDIINAAITMYAELDYFNFNESIFFCYERLMWWRGDEQANNDSRIKTEEEEPISMIMMQEMLINFIREFVEGACSEIRSGWRSIFRALRGFRLPSKVYNSEICSIPKEDQPRDNNMPQIDVLVDIWNAYLSTPSVHVFAYASVDYVQCLMHILRNNIVRREGTSMTPALESVFVIFLKYLQRFAKLLRDRRAMPEESFVLAPYVRRRKATLIDVNLLRQALLRGLSDDRKCEFSFNLSLMEDISQEYQPTPIAQLWFLLLDEFAATMLTSHLEHRQMQIEVYMALLEMTPDVVVHDVDANKVQSSSNAAEDFTLNCYNRIVLPLMQNFLRESLRFIDESQRLSEAEQSLYLGDSKEKMAESHLERLYTFYNSWLKAFNENIARFLVQLHHQNRHRQSQTSVASTGCQEALKLLYKQILLVYLECFTPDYPELVKIVAISSLRILMASLMPIFEEGNQFWSIFLDCFKVGHQLTIWPLRLLLDCFTGLPQNFMEEFNRIKILTTRSNRAATESIRRLARRVFYVHLPGGREGEQESDENEPKKISRLARLEDNRIFTIVVETESGVKRSFVCNQLIAQLYLHLAWLQVFCGVITTGLEECVLADIVGFLKDYDNIISTTSNDVGQEDTKSQPLMSYLTVDQFQEVQALLASSFRVACEFDSRPGLKFLLQYVAEMETPTNLYHLAALCWTTQFCLVYERLILLARRQDYDEMAAQGAALEELIQEMITIYDSRYGKLDPEVTTRRRLLAQLNRPPPSDPFILLPVKDFNAQLVLDEVQGTTGKEVTLPQGMEYNVSQLIPSSVLAADFLIQKRKFQKRNRGAAAESPASTIMAVNSFNDSSAEAFFQADSLLAIRIWNEIVARCLKVHSDANDNEFQATVAHLYPLANFSIAHPYLSFGNGQNPTTSDPKVEQMQRWIQKLMIVLMSQSKMENIPSMTTTSESLSTTYDNCQFKVKFY